MYNNFYDSGGSARGPVMTQRGGIGVGGGGL